MIFKTYFDILKFKIISLFKRRIRFTALIFNSVVAKKAAIKQHTRFYNSKIKDYSFTGRNCLIQNTEIGKFVSISDNCCTGLPMHPLDYVSTSPVFLHGKNVIRKNFAQLNFKDIDTTIIGNDVWIG